MVSFILRSDLLMGLTLRNLFCKLLSRAGYGSESEADDEAATVNLPTNHRESRASSKSAVKLQEIGPRMTLQLIKVEEGLCSGGVIFSEHGTLLSNLCGTYIVPSNSYIIHFLSLTLVFLSYSIIF